MNIPKFIVIVSLQNKETLFYDFEICFQSENIQRIIENYILFYTDEQGNELSKCRPVGHKYYKDFLHEICREISKFLIENNHIKSDDPNICDTIMYTWKEIYFKCYYGNILNTYYDSFKINIMELNTI